MKPLVTHQRVLIWLCMCSAEKSVNNRERVIHIGLFSTCLIASVSLWISSMTFFSRFVSIDLEGALFAFIYIMISTVSVYQLIVAVILRNKIGGILVNLMEIYKSNANKDSFRYLVQANNKSEWIWTIYFKYMVFAAVSTTIMSIVSVFSCWITYGHFEADHVYHPFKLILPWNRATLIGYTAEILFVIVTGEVCLGVNGALLLLFISLCLHHHAFYQMFKHSVAKLDRPDKKRCDKKSLCDLIRFHILVKDWFVTSAAVYSPFIVVMLICSMMHLAGCVFQMELLLKHIGFDVAIVLVGIPAAMSTLFLYCYFGKFATERFLNMSDCLYESQWHDLPVDFQKYCFLIIGYAQRPLLYHGFSIARLNLQTFTSLIKNVFTFYMMFKTITSQ